MSAPYKRPLLLLLIGVILVQSRWLSGRMMFAAAVLGCLAYFPLLSWWMWSSPNSYRQANAMVAFASSCVEEKPSIYSMATPIGTEDLAIAAERKDPPPGGPPAASAT